MIDPGTEFEGVPVVVTGAAGVIGRWIADAFAKAGANLVLSDVREEALRDLAADLGLSEDRCLLHATELRDAASVRDLVDHTVATFGAPQVVVNNAGIYPSGFLLDLDVDDWDRMFDVNLRAPYLVGIGFAREMIRAGVKGSIINVGSGAARSMRATMVPYCTSKTALDRLTKGMSLELAEFGVRVNVVEPGFAPGSHVSHLSDEHVRETSAKIPLGRATGPEDAPGAILFLASSHAAYVTGATLSVDGGNSAGSRAVYQDKKKADA